MNLNFLNTSFLWALPFAALPVLFHFLFKRPPTVVPFGDLRFLKQVYEKARPRKKLREWLILLLRVLALASLFLFFSRPVAHFGGGSGALDSVAMAVLVDSSSSMRAQEAGLSRWDKALQAARSAFGTLRETDRSSLIIVSDQVDSSSGYLANDHKMLASSLDGAEPSWRGTNILPALQAAYQSLHGSAASNKVILILSDMARHGWAAIDGGMGSKLENFDPSVRIIAADFGTVRNNFSVQDVRLIPDPYSGVLRVEADVKNWGERGDPELPVYLSLKSVLDEKERRTQAFADLPAGEQRASVLSMPSKDARFYSGSVSLREDAFHPDDVFYFSEPSPKQMRILIAEEPAGLTALSGESYFLRQALEMPPSPFDVRSVSVNELAGLPLKDFDALVLINPGELDPLVLESVTRYLNSGGACFLTMGERSALGGLRSLEGKLPCAFGGVRETGGMALTAASGISEQDYEWDKVSIQKIAQPVLIEGSETWLTLADGTPALMFSANRKVAVWASSVDRSWNNLPARPVFVPLMRQVLTTIASRAPEGGQAHLTVGEKLKVSRADVGDESVKLISPSGKKIPVKVWHREIESAPLDEPGLYVMDLSGGEKRVFAVNVDRSRMESDLSAVSEKEIMEKMPGVQVMRIKAGSGFASELTAALRGKELSRFFLILAGVLLLCEALLRKS